MLELQLLFLVWFLDAFLYATTHLLLLELICFLDILCTAVFESLIYNFIYITSIGGQPRDFGKGINVFFPL